ncbi:hypothetical protein D3C85_1695620 [compost metagenome]
MQKKTIRKNKFKAKALVRSASVKNGVNKLLNLLSRADVNEVSSVVNTPQAVDIVLLKGL